MTAKIELKTASGGKVILDPQDTAVDATLVLPATSGTIQTSGATLTTSGNLTFTGTGNRITGDFSNGTFANRVFFQTSTSGGNTSLGLIPHPSNATPTTTFEACLSSDPANSNVMQAQVTTTDVRFNSGARGTASFLPMTFYTGGSERLRIDTSGNVGIGGTPNGSYKLQVNNGSVYVGVNSDATNGVAESNGPFFVRTNTANPLIFGTGSGGTERMRIDSSGNVGIGTSSINGKLSVDGSVYAAAGSVSGVAYGFYPASTYGNTGMFSPAANTVAFATSGGERMRIDSSGNVGIGTTSPGAKLDVSGNILLSAGTPKIFFNNGGSMISNGGSANTLAFFSDGTTERARIDSSGNLLVGMTTTSGVGVRLAPAATVIVNNNAAASGHVFMSFRRSTTEIGSVSQSGTTAVTYATSSDYRLKENIQPMQNALETVAQLKPCTYTWKADGSAGQGFIAHELQEIVPDCVVGEKDAVDEDGNPKYQGVDTSFLVATLTAAIQELTTELNNVKAELAAMKGSA